MSEKKLVCQHCEKETKNLQLSKCVQVKGKPMLVCPTCSARLERLYGNLSKKVAGFLGM
jgi:protein-arginine kinase activator protein McsA